MLQFEPQLSYEYVFPGKGGPRPVVGGGAGAVFHYGPDYNSSADNRSADFFAAGPLFSLSAVVRFATRSGSCTPGITAFYSPLFGEGDRRGTVAGGALELHYSP